MSIADGIEHRLDPQWIVVSRIGAAIFVLVLTLLSGVPMAYWTLFGLETTTARVAVFLGWSIGLTLFGGFLLWWPAIRYRHTSYRVTEEAIYIRRGVWWRSVEVVPTSRVQHTDIAQGPIDRSFNLATLIIYTAGTEHASIGLGGLPRATAQKIRDHLIDVRGEDAV